MYKETLEMLRDMFPGRAIVSIPEAAAAIGANPQSLREDPSLAKTRYGKQKRIALPALAHYICKGAAL